MFASRKTIHVGIVLIIPTSYAVSKFACVFSTFWDLLAFSSALIIYDCMLVYEAGVLAHGHVLMTNEQPKILLSYIHTLRINFGFSPLEY